MRVQGAPRRRPLWHCAFSKRKKRRLRSLARIKTTRSTQNIKCHFELSRKHIKKHIRARVTQCTVSDLGRSHAADLEALVDRSRLITAVQVWSQAILNCMGVGRDAPLLKFLGRQKDILKAWIGGMVYQHCLSRTTRAWVSKEVDRGARRAWQWQQLLSSGCDTPPNWIMITSQRLSFRSLDRSSLLRCGGGAFQLEFCSSHSCGGERKQSGLGGRPL